MKRLSIALIALLIIAVLFIGAIFIVPGLVPTDTYRDKMESELSQTMGRDVKITGDIKISTFPVVKIQTGPVSLANPDGFSDNNFVDVQAMSAKVRLLPLLSKQVEIKGVTFDSPNIRLEKRADGAMNWMLSDSTEASFRTETTEAGPYKRDGRFTEYDPALDLLKISDGSFIYSDAVAGREIKAEKINLDLRAPSLDKPVSLKGDLIVEGLPTSLDAKLDSPLDFMSGIATNFDAKIKTSEGEIDTSGTFKQGEEIAFDANFDTDIIDPMALAKRLPLPDTVKFPDLTAVRANGDITYGPNTTRLPNVTFAAEGPGMSVNYSGAIDASDGVVASGDFEAKLDDMSIVTPYLKKPIEALDIVKTVDAKGTLDWNGSRLNLPAFNGTVEGTEMNAAFNGSGIFDKTLALKGDFEASSADMSVLRPYLTPYLKKPIKALEIVKTVDAKGTVDWDGSRLNMPAFNGSVGGTQLSAEFNGSGSFDKTLALSGDFQAKSDDLSILTPYLSKPIAALNAVNAVDAKGAIDLDGPRVNFSALNSSVTGPQVNATFNGSGSFDKKLALNGTFNGETPNLETLLKEAGISQPDAAAVKRLTASGNIALANNSQVTLTNFAATASEGFVNGQYNGQVGYDKKLTLNGQVSGDITDLGALNAAIPREIPYADIAQRVTLSSQIANKGSGYALSGLTAALEGGLLTGDFNGRLATGNESDISGTLNVASSSLRSIARSQNIDLPISTDAGPIFEAFNLSGQVSGTPNRINFTNGNLGLDSLSGSGNFMVQLGQAKPNLTGNLALGTLDLRPYMAAWSTQNPTGQILPWATTPIDLNALNSVNSQIDLTTPAIITDRVQLGQTDTSVKISNGVLTTNIRRAQIYNGQVDGTFAIGASRGVPSLNIQTNVRSVDAMNFLMATSGFEKVSGTADLTMSIQGNGRSQDAIMKSLSGSGTFKVLNGQLLGIDAANLLSGVDQALVSRQLPLGAASGIGGSTDFNDLDGTFSMSQGRANVNQFQVQSRTLFMDAEGVIDVGNQNIDFRMRPMLSEGSDVAQVGIPLRFSGKFGQAKPGLDSSFLSQIIQAKAAKKARDLITDQVGGQLGGVLGGVLGGGSTAPQSGTASGSSSPLSGLGLPIPGLGTQQPSTAPSQQQTQEAPPPPPQPEEQIEDALKSIFGKKKKR